MSLANCVSSVTVLLQHPRKSCSYFSREWDHSLMRGNVILAISTLCSFRSFNVVSCSLTVMFPNEEEGRKWFLLLTMEGNVGTFQTWNWDDFRSWVIKPRPYCLVPLTPFGFPGPQVAVPQGQDLGPRVLVRLAGQVTRKCLHNISSFPSRWE